VFLFVEKLAERGQAFTQFLERALFDLAGLRRTTERRLAPFGDFSVSVTEISLNDHVPLLFGQCLVDSVTHRPNHVTPVWRLNIGIRIRAWVFDIATRSVQRNYVQGTTNTLPRVITARADKDGFTLMSKPLEPRRKLGVVVCHVFWYWSAPASHLRYAPTYGRNLSSFWANSDSMPQGDRSKRWELAVSRIDQLIDAVQFANSFGHKSSLWILLAARWRICFSLHGTER
jgi:hypothetical protein